MGGYWLVWDTRSQFSFLATLEWLGIAARAGTSIGSLYQFFPNKKALFDGLLVDEVDRVVEAIAPTYSPGAGATGRCD